MNWGSHCTKGRPAFFPSGRSVSAHWVDQYFAHRVDQRLALRVSESHLFICWMVESGFSQECGECLLGSTLESVYVT